MAATRRPSSAGRGRRGEGAGSGNVGARISPTGSSTRRVMIG